MVYKSDHARIVDLEQIVAQLKMTLTRVIEYHGLPVEVMPNLPDNIYDSGDPVPGTFKTGDSQFFTASGTECKDPEVIETIGIPDCVTNQLRNPKEIS